MIPISDPGWIKRKEDMAPPPRIDVDGLSGESNSYFSVSCSDCQFKNKCHHRDENDSGCRMRKEIYDNLFTQMEFKTQDAITLNRIRLLTKYYIELVLRRNFGSDFLKSEVQLYKTTILELGKLSIDKKGELINTNQKTIVPWEASEDDEHIRKEIEEKQKLELEVVELRKLKPKKKEEGEEK